MQTNKFHVKGSRQGPRDQGGRDELQGGMRKPNKEILEHNRRRALEVKLLELRDKLESEGYAAGDSRVHHDGVRDAHPRVSPPTLQTHGGGNRGALDAAASCAGSRS